MVLLFNPRKKDNLLCYNMLLDVKPVVYICDAIHETQTIALLFESRLLLLFDLTKQ